MVAAGTLHTLWSGVLKEGKYFKEREGKCRHLVRAEVYCVFGRYVNWVQAWLPWRVG